MDIIRQNKELFDIFKHLSNDEINLFEGFNMNNICITDLLNNNITKDNVYDILYICRLYQYNKMDEIINEIQYLIMDKQIKINKNKLNNPSLYDLIYNNECLKYGRRKPICNLHDKIHSIACIKYWTKHGYLFNHNILKYVKDENILKYILDNKHLIHIKK